MIWKIIASVGASSIVKVFTGISGPIFKHFQSKDIQETNRQGIWADAMMEAAKADVAHRRLAQRERASNPFIMFMFLNIIGWPTLYWSLFWADTIFQFDWDLPRAPERLEAYGKEVIQWGFGFGASTYGIIKGARVLKGAGLFRR